MKRLVLILLAIVVLSGLNIQKTKGTCSLDPNYPNTISGFTIEAGQKLEWRVRAIDPDYDLYGGYVDVIAGVNPPWVTFGPRITPDNNQYVFFTRNTDCNGTTVDPNIALIVSRKVTIAPPKAISGNFEIKFAASDTNNVTYWRIPFVVTRPQQAIPSGDAGRDVIGPYSYGSGGSGNNPVARISVTSIVEHGTKTTIE